MALIRIREAADAYLSPRKPSVSSSEAPPSAAHVGDMLADLLGGLEGPAPSNRVPRHDPADTSSWGSAGITASVATSNGTVSVSSAGTVPPPPPSIADVGTASPASPTPVSTQTFPAAGAGRRNGRPRVVLAAVSHSWLSLLDGPALPWMSNLRADHQLLLRSTFRCVSATTAGVWRTPGSSGSSAGRTDQATHLPPVRRSLRQTVSVSSYSRRDPT